MMKNIIVYYYPFWIGVALVITGLLEIALKTNLLPFSFLEKIEYLQGSSACILAGIGCIMFALIPSPWEITQNAKVYTTLFVIALLFIIASIAILFL